MRRFLLILFLFVLPIQFAWGAAAAYCGHEGREQAARHVGHHEHQHQGGMATPDAANADAETAGLNSYHGDCETCHLGSGVSLPPASTKTVGAHRVGFHSDHSARYQSHIPFGPERPDRS
ncbi:MAG: hypothetical protein IPF55_10320 [Rhodoferax sp.]|nr:hypothetical protein [Rhodoferax sp.]